jgi:hypothetical protein
VVVAVAEGVVAAARAGVGAVAVPWVAVVVAPRGRAAGAVIESAGTR